MLIQNSLFLQEKIFPTKDNSNIFISNESVRGRFQNLMELDFSKIWPKVIIKENIGSETNNCACCIPENIYSGNIFPNSLVSVRFLSDAFYYDSRFSDFSNKFHLGNSNKERRLARKAEFLTKNIPIGPFFFGDSYKIPIEDAKILQKEGFAEILPNNNELHWSCRNEKSFLSNAIEMISSKSEKINSNIESYEKIFLHQYKLNALMLLESDLNYYFMKQYSNLLNAIFNKVPNFLLDTKNQYYSKVIAESFRSKQQSLIAEWSEIMKKEGTRIIAIDSFCNKIFIQGEYLTPDFFLKKDILMPICNNHHADFYF